MVVQVVVTEAQTQFSHHTMPAQVSLVGPADLVVEAVVLELILITYSMRQPQQYMAQLALVEEVVVAATHKVAPAVQQAYLDITKL